MTKISQQYNLKKSQSELDFVDVPIARDLPLFLDPFAISLRPEPFAQECHQNLLGFFQAIVDAIRNDDREFARRLLLNLREPNETRLGLSKGRPRGAGLGDLQSGDMLNALTESSAVKTGFLHSLEECELMVEGVGRDKISDLTTNIIRRHLANYTLEQCNLLNIPTRKVALDPYYLAEQQEWVSDYFDLPVAGNRPIVFVPKTFVRFDPAYNQQKFYGEFVLEFLQAEALNANSSLVRTLKSGRRVVYKKDLKPTFPLTKENLFKFAKEHPEILHEYREYLKTLEIKGTGALVDESDEKQIAESLIAALKSIQPGNDTASEYHSLVVGIVEFLFFPSLLYPRKEQEIHDGRKRIDIVMENGARSGILNRLHNIRKLPCSHVAIECKNCGRELGNPELDQICGRFSPLRGRLGIIFCRSLADRDLFIKRCRDTLKDQRGLVIVFDDNSTIECLALIKAGNREALDEIFTRHIDEVWYS